MGDPGVVVGEHDLEGRVGRDLEGVRVIGDPGRGDRDLHHGAAVAAVGRSHGGRAGGCRRGAAATTAEGILPAGWDRGCAGRHRVALVPPAGVLRRVARGGVLHGVGQRARRPNEGDELLELAVVEGSLGLEPGKHQRVRVTADVASADGEHRLQVLRGQVREELGLLVENRPDPALARVPVTARAVRRVERGTPLDVRHLLGRRLLLHPAGALDAGHTELVEEVADDEDDDERNDEEGDPARAPALADDLRGALGRKADGVGLGGGGEALRGRDLGRLARDRQPLLGPLAGLLVGHRVPRSLRSTTAIRCTPSGSWRAPGRAGRARPGASRG